MNIYKKFTHIFCLNNDEKQALQSLIQNLGNIDFEYQRFHEKLILNIHDYSRHIPERLIHFLWEFRNSPNDEGAIVIQNLPIDELLPSTPTNREYSGKSTFYSEWLLLLLMSSIADVIAYKEEVKGKYIHDIVPRQDTEQLQINSGSVWLEFHTEHGFHPYKQDYIALICLRSDHEKKAMTLGTSIHHALRKLNSDTITILQQKRYRIHLPDSFLETPGEKYFSPPISVLSEDLKIPSMCVDFDAMRAMDGIAENALKFFEAALQECMMGKVLVPGEMLLIDNQLVAHARAAFKPRYDGQDRWLQRISGVRDIRRVKNSCLDNTYICRPVVEESLWKNIIKPRSYSMPPIKKQHNSCIEHQV